MLSYPFNQWYLNGLVLSQNTCSKHLQRDLPPMFIQMSNIGWTRDTKSGTVFSTHASLNLAAVVGVRGLSVSSLKPTYRFVYANSSTKLRARVCACVRACACFCARPANEINRSDFPHLALPLSGGVGAANPKASVLTVDDLRLSG